MLMAGGGWHATGAHPAWGMLCMQLGCTATWVPQASPHFPREEKAPGLSGPAHLAPSLLQEDLGQGVCCQRTALPLARPWESSSGLGGAGVTP